MPPGTPYHSFALPYPIRVDNFTDTLDNLPTPYNRPRLHLLTHTHSDHITGLASKSFAYRVVCSPDAKEMLLRHEVYAERALHDNAFRAEKKRTFGHLKVDPYVTPNGHTFFTGSRDLLHAVPLNTPTEFDISDSETVTITLIDANHCPGSVMFLIEGSRGTVLHTGDLRAEPWFLSSIQRNHFLQPYLAASSEDLRVFVARREGTHIEATGLVKTLEAIYLDTACLLSPVVVPTKEHAVQGIVGLMALFPASTHFFINTWTWGYEDVLKGIARAFHCHIHLDRYKHSIYSHGSDPVLRALGTRDAASTRFHACERFDRCSFVDVPPYDYWTKGAVSPPSKQGKKVVYVNAVNMGCARWEDYHANIKRRVLRGENVDSLLVPLSRHSPLPELMNFVALFRPLRVVPNTLDPLLDGLDWGAMSKMFSGCLSPASTLGSLASVMAPPCSLTDHPSVASLPGPSTMLDLRKLSTTGGDEDVDTAYANLIGPSDAADQWADKGGQRSKLRALKVWMGSGRGGQHGGSTRLHRVLYTNQGSGRFPVNSTPRRDARDDDSGDSSDEGGSDEHARIAWKLFGVGELVDARKTWVSPSPSSTSQCQIDMGTLPTPTSSPCFREKRLEGRKVVHTLTTPVKTLERAPTEMVPSPDPCRRMSLVLACTSPFVSFEDVGQSAEERTSECGEGSQPFACLDNVVFSDPSQDLGSSTQPESQPSPSPRKRKENTENVGDTWPSKRPRIDRETSKATVAHALIEECTTCGESRLTRTPTVPCVAGVVGSVSLMVSTAVPTHTNTLSFPVRKRVDAACTAKTTGGRSELASCSTSAIGIAHPPSTSTSVVRASTIAAYDGSGEPVSPRTAARRAARAERRRITERLRLARPDMVVGVTGGTHEGGDAEMDWEKSRCLAEKVREVVKMGGRASDVLPRLKCLEAWYATRG